MMNVAMYLRKSRAEELTDTVDDTLKRHKETLTEFAQKNHLMISGIYEEVVSGESLYTRPQMLKLLADVEHGDFNAVLCMDIDRLGRGSMSDQGIILETLKAADTKIITPRKIYDLNNDIDETYSEFESFMARQELKVIKRRMQRGIHRTIEDGGYLANAPYGYKKIHIGKHPTLEIRENEARFVRLIFDLYVNKGYGCQHIAETINAMGAKPHRSEQFGRVSIIKILKNQTYTGKIVWNQKTQIRSGSKGFEKTKYLYHPPEEWLVVDGLQKPIIDQNLFGRAQEIIARHAHPPVNTGKVKNPLAGLLYCKHCGNPMQRQVIRRGGAYLICPKHSCMVSSSLSLVEIAVVKVLHNQFENLFLETDIRTDLHQGHYSEIQTGMESERKGLNRQMEKLHDLLEQGVYTIEVYVERHNILLQKLEKIDFSEKQFLRETTEAKQKLQSITIRNIVELYEASSPQKRNELLKAFISKIIYSKQTGAKPNEFNLEIFFVPFYL